MGERNNKGLRRPELELSYLDIQAYAGITKHMGGVRATRELLELCHIDKGKYVLDVGCGIGITPCYITKRYGCRVVGVDISETMIHWSKERAKREGLEDRVEFRVADAQNLPFEDDLFDIVICESVNAFIEDKQRAVSEYVRVVRPGGYVGLNETIWVKAPPPEFVELVGDYTEIKGLLTPDGWKELLEGSGLRDVVARTYKVSGLGELVDRIRWLGFKGILTGWGRVLSLYIGSPASRESIKKQLSSASTPREILEYMGYGIYVGRNEGVTHHSEEG